MLRFTPIRALVVLGVIAVSCEDENEVTNKQIAVQFEAPTLVLNEDDDEHEIRIVLSEATPVATTIPVKVSGTVGFISSPAVVSNTINVAVAKGETEGVFTIKPDNNSSYEADRTFDLEIGNLQRPLVAGQQLSFAVTIKEDDAAPSVANFVQSGITINENDAAGAEYVIQLSEPAALESKLVIDLGSDKGVYATHFTTSPEPVNGKIEIIFEAGQQTAVLRVNAIPNTEATGELTITLSIVGATGSLVKGNNVAQTLKIVDDEMHGKAKGFVVSHSGGLYEVGYEYDLQGRVYKRHWVTRELTTRSGTDTYFYNEFGKISKVNKHLGRDITYLWNDGRVTRAEETQDGDLRSYVEYEYDAQGNVAGVFPFYKQNDGTFAAGIFTVYLYFTDGNVYKSLSYNPVNDGEPILLSTKTYENYSEADNPFPMVEIIPTVVSQKKLPGSYQVEEHGTTRLYYMDYKFDDEGVLVERTASATGDTQVATYQYY